MTYSPGSCLANARAVSAQKEGSSVATAADIWKLHEFSKLSIKERVGNVFLENKHNYLDLDYRKYSYFEYRNIWYSYSLFPTVSRIQ